MPTTLQNAAREAVQAKPCQNFPQTCNGCRDNFYLPELHNQDALAALDVFDARAVQGQIDRRRACTARPAAHKPCLPPPRPAAVAPATAPAPEPTVPALVLQAQDDTEAVRTTLHSINAMADMLASGPAVWLEDDLQTLLAVLHDTLQSRLLGLATQLDTVRQRLPLRPVPRGCLSSALASDQHKRLALEACDQAESLCRDSAAFAALRDLAQHAHSTASAHLATTLHLIADHQAAQLKQLDDTLDELHAALEADLAAAPVLAAELAAAAQFARQARAKSEAQAVA